MIERFVRYTTYNTQPKYDQPKTPSTEGQYVLAKVVLEDMKEAGVIDLELGEDCFLYGTIPANLPSSFPSGAKVPTIGFLAHFDTATDSPGGPVKARFIENYAGGVIKYPAAPEITLTPENDPHLKNCTGHTIITSDGTTLLGGDDKAGIAVLVEMGHYFKEHPEVHHGRIRLAIIPDEEIGVGTEKIDLKKFGADVAYTIDGEELGKIDVESFNGFMGKIDVEGYVAFPGYGKGTYINAIQVMSKFVAAMDDGRWPQNCSGDQPIWWLDELTAGVGKASTKVFLRDFELEGIEKQKARLEQIKLLILKEFPRAKISIDIKESYKNYKYELNKDPRIVSYAEEAMNKVGVKPNKNFVRGGNDACHLCFSGLLSTNLFIGMKNMHSVREWNTVETIEASLKTVTALAGVWLEHSK